jgi:hypothetical protein
MMTDVSNATRLTFSNGIGGSDQDGHGHTLIRGNLPSHTVRSRDLRASQDTINSVATLAEGVAGVKGSYKRQAPLSAAGPGQAGWRQSVDTNKSFSLAPTKEVVEVAAMYKVRNGGLVLSGALAVQVAVGRQMVAGRPLSGKEAIRQLPPNPPLDAGMVAPLMLIGSCL